MATDARTPEMKTIFLAEKALVYCFDFSNEPAVTGGATISAPVVAVDVAKVSATGAAVITSIFQEFDANGNLGDSVPADKGVKIAVTPLARGQCMVSCVVTASDGSTPGKTVIFLVR